MTDLPPNAPEIKPGVPVFAVNAGPAAEAFAVYSALARLAVDDPELGRLPLMQELRKTAYDRFNAAFELMP